MKALFEHKFKELSGILVDQMNPSGFWTGELSSSALGVAVALAALHFDDPEANRSAILPGLTWLKEHINVDGSFGDTPESPGNTSTTLLVYAAVNLYVGEDDGLKDLQLRMAEFLAKESVDVTADKVSESILGHYKKDYTFSVPILTMCALCGIPGKDAFKNIPQLPFELSLLPRRFYRMLNLSVVSYAIPALVAVGIVIFRKKKSGWLQRWLRKKSVDRAMVILDSMLPDSGGFLEAIPLTAFVSLSLIHAGYSNHRVVKQGIGFLKRTQRSDGSWPIDVNLSTWVTTLSVKSLRSERDKVLTAGQKEQLTSHLLAIQNKTIHPFNGTGKGGWGWTSFAGSVPDCDDTPGVILALLQLSAPEKVQEEILAGCRWLFTLQNKDGGFPTFSKGWGKLPFDQSCADLTGHCLLALTAAFHHFSKGMEAGERRKFRRSIHLATAYLVRHQLPDGSWLPLWFGNQNTRGHFNPVYGTARVITYLQDSMLYPEVVPALANRVRDCVICGTGFLLKAQNRDGSWGGAANIPGTIEETSLAISALISAGMEVSAQEGFKWLEDYHSQNGMVSAPIGLYFASLWYDEKMYPLTSYLEAVAREIEL